MDAQYPRHSSLEREASLGFVPHLRHAMERSQGLTDHRGQRSGEAPRTSVMLAEVCRITYQFQDQDPFLIIVTIELGQVVRESHALSS